MRWTPRWSARDVLAHLVDTAERAVAGEEGPPADEQAHAAVLAAVGHDPGPGADDAYERFRELFSRRDVPGAFFS